MTTKASHSYCPYLWSGLSLRDGVGVYPCCRFDAGASTSTLLKSGNVEEIFNSPYFQEIRSRALSDKPNLECQKCILEEQHGIPSGRQMGIEDDPRIFSSTMTHLQNITLFEVFVGKTCNLKCHGCHPLQSTKWEDDYNKAGWEWSKAPENKVDSADLIWQMSNLQHIKIIGGEPALCQETLEILAAVDTKNRSKIDIEISTNGTILFSDELLSLLSEFKKVYFNISIDGFDKVNELIRYPSRWPLLEKNVETYLAWAQVHPNIQLILHCTVHALNVFSIDLLETWWRGKIANSQGTSPRSRYAILTQPEKLHIGNLPLSLRQPAAKKLNGFSEKFASIRSVLLSSSSEEAGSHFAELISYCLKLDEIRKTDTRAVVPEIFENPMTTKEEEV